MLEFRINGVEEIAEDLKEHSNWDMEKLRAASIAFRIDQYGAIDQDILHLGGFVEAKCLDGCTMFGRNYTHPDHQIKIGRIDLSTFIFRGSLNSAHLGPNEFNWTVERPATTVSGAWCEVPREVLQREGGSLLHARAVCQPWTGAVPRLRINLGLFVCDDIKKIPDADHDRFPFVHIGAIYAAFMPIVDGLDCGLPSMPYLIDM